MVARNVCGERREGRERREASAGRSGASDRTARRARKKNVGQRTHDHLMQVFNVPWSVPGGEYHSLLRKARSHSSSEGLENRKKGQLMLASACDRRHVPWRWGLTDGQRTSIPHSATRSRLFITIMRSETSEEWPFSEGPRGLLDEPVPDAIKASASRRRSCRHFCITPANIN